MGAAHTSEFQRSLDAHTAGILRPRFMGFLATLGAVYLFSILLLATPAALALSGIVPGGAGMTQRLLSGFRWGEGGLWILGGLVAVDLGVYAWCWYRILRRPMAREEMVAFTQRYFFFRGIMDIAAGFVAHQAGFPWSVAFYHVLACVFLPWSPAQALRPIGPLLVINALVILIFRESPAWVKGLVMILSLFSAAPGLAIAALKQSRRMDRFKLQMLQTRYGQMRRELVDARRIHEALFPPPLSDGPVRLDYCYEPMRQIGGDYLYARFAPSPPDDPDCPGCFNVLLLDVTGHGIAAALTVNRLYGEVERVFAENPHVGPGEILSALNRYVHLTLSNHSIYATALCIRVNAAEHTIEYASGGHPPAYLFRYGGRIEALDSTAPVLGACAASEFDPCVVTREFGPGERLIAYTDGAIEARNDAGRMMGIDGLLRVLATCCRDPESARSGVVATVLSAVEAHRYGPPEDDTLIVELIHAHHHPSRGDRHRRQDANEDSQMFAAAPVA